MENQKIQELLTKFDKEDPEITGIVEFDIAKASVIASTFSEDYNKKTIEIEQAIADLETNRILKLDPCGPKNWAMYSFGKKIVVTARIKNDVWITMEYAIEKAPSACIEDALEIALMVNQSL